eukprot:jgi/Pico_ML_1/51321/g2375.t1
MYREALQLLVAAEGADHPSVGALLDHMGLFYAQLENWKEAEKVYRKSLLAKKESLGDQHQEYAATLALLAEALAGQDSRRRPTGTAVPSKNSSSTWAPAILKWL